AAVTTVIAHDVVKAVTLTGSEHAGMRVGEAAGRALKKCVLELGGSDPFIVLDDADLDLAVAGAIRGRMVNTGQSCIAAKRFFVHEKIAEEFETKFAEKMKTLLIGNPMKRETQVGPLAKSGFVADIDRQVQESIAQGATLLCGGKQTAVFGKGYFYEPTILTHVTSEMAVFKEETFGPVAAITHFKSDEDAIVLANMTPYGLGGSVWSTEKDRAEKIAKQIDAGCVFVNQFVKSDARVPFGGVKKSGYGRELSSYGIKEFVNVKTVWVQ
ncbi:aldehyde dehydrogenase family protein, partial [Candidatus Woesearchaeota archaeon]|nr:aldehyde dehydrogenase family protein [Candidatus Woesearchaeota archaeon]